MKSIERDDSPRSTQRPQATLAHPLLRQAATGRRLDALFRAMAGDYLLREQFVTEPTQILFEYVHGRRLDAEAAAVNDQLVYAVLSSPALLVWLRDYLGARRAGREEFMRAFVQAVVRHDAAPVVTALARAAVSGYDVLDADSAAFPLLIDLLAREFGSAVAHTEISTGHSTGTEMSTGHGGGTEKSTGSIFAQTEMSTGHSTGTEMSTGHGLGSVLTRIGNIFAQTEMSTGHSTGTEMSTGHGGGTERSTGSIFAQTEMSTGHSTGTEMSTGHGGGTEQSTGSIFAQTEMSTGHSTGTEMSTGHDLGSLGGDFRRITLAALADYAVQLRRQGALDLIWGR
jgi:hypothetical protein